jgi:hypothetical protein
MMLALSKQQQLLKLLAQEPMACRRGTWAFQTAIVYSKKQTGEYTGIMTSSCKQHSLHMQ